MILQAKNISKSFAQQRGWLKRRQQEIYALKDITFSLNQFQTLGLLGESGCGKTTLAKILLKLLLPTSGEIIINQQIIKDFRKDVAIIFQNPYNSLDPKMKIVDIISEPLAIHKITKRANFTARARQLLQVTGLEESALYRYPFEFSGGQRQRISIARALAVEPKLLVLDEPVSSLDLTIQLDILNLFLELKHKLGLTYIFISHNLAVVKYIAEKLIVMRQGQIIEEGDSDKIFLQPAHPYTKSLIEAFKA